MYFRSLLLVCLCTFALSSQAQRSGIIRGVVRSYSGSPLQAITVKIAELNKITTTNPEGEYQFSNVASGKYTLVFTGVGLKKLEEKMEVKAGEESFLEVILHDHSVDLNTVTVVGRTEVQEVNRQAFNVAAIDAKQLYNSTLDLSSALDRVSGVRVRESGGVGSNFNLSLNGFSGNRIRYFIDGVPMDNFGSSFQINNIPINIADRLEVYKGVVPIWLGSDALGGAINIVTGDRYRNYVDASYSYGSFNTHRSVVNAAFTTKGGFTFRLNAFQNYSDNNYKVTLDVADIYTGAFKPNTVVRRFHDTYHNETLVANVGVVGKKFADQLLFGITLGKNYKELQTGARMVAVFGGWHRRGNIVMPTLKYRKTDLIKGLDLTVNANYNLGKEQNIDTLSARFDWYGNSKPHPSGEGRGKSLAKYGNNNGLVTATANYKLTDQQSIALSNAFSTFNRQGSDAFNENFTRGDVRPRLNKNVLGLGYTYNEKEKWSTSIFGKYLYQNTPGQQAFNKLGFGAAVSYFITPSLQLKASYERANRLPEANELFGDVELVQGNLSLKPEESQNINAGFSYGFAAREDHRFLINANAIYRYSYNYIYSRLNQNQSALILDNLDGVFTMGGEGELRYSYKKFLTIGTTLTYQYLQNQQQYVYDNNNNLVLSPVYKDQMPNIPYLFGNADASLTLRNLGQKGNVLNIGYNLLYVHAFWLYWPSRGGNDGGDKYGIPMQLSHDLNAVYSINNGRYNIGLEVRNLTDRRLYDNFSLQKPGRGFYVNLRYFFNSFKI
ncbi:TonB-dependent receptor [Siphonobacter sp. SORGH_AS_0500]|uniref:TonB-dependent receptor n=2 Tax=Siphonobacter sp. SORGH_AS_0500 TaxID=1864824 RepID=UPI002863EA80|nr:TonB-dependent receptor [Siphonobacter sp. SORGH_AS_0500]MDR6197033.1 outer membrane receptor protein involved in Fe transport [Siphonobacter sp. SORGH_AS_0500]